MVRSGCHSPHAAPAPSQLLSAVAQADERPHDQASSPEKSGNEGRVPRSGVSPQPGQAEIHVTQRATADSRAFGVSQSVCKPSSCPYLRFRLLTPTIMPPVDCSANASYLPQVVDASNRATAARCLTALCWTASPTNRRKILRYGVAVKPIPARRSRGLLRG